MRFIITILLLFPLIASGQTPIPVGIGGIEYVPNSTSTYSVVATATKEGTSTGATTSAIDAHLANFVLVGSIAYNGVPSISDNGGHTWTTIAGCTQSNGTQYSAFFYATGTFSSSFTVTIGAIANVHVWAMSGVSGSPVDKSANNAGTSGNPTSSSFTPTHSGEYVFSVASGYANTSLPTVPSGWSANGLYGLSAGNNYCGGGASYLQSVSASINPVWTIATAEQWVCASVAIY